MRIHQAQVQFKSRKLNQGLKLIWYQTKIRKGRQRSECKSKLHESEHESKLKKLGRLLESSDEESDDDNDENERAGERNEREVAASGGTAMNTASEERRDKETGEPSGTKQASSSKTIGQKTRKLEEATRRSTRQRKEVDEMGGVMIHLFDQK